MRDRYHSSNDYFAETSFIQSKLSIIFVINIREGNRTVLYYLVAQMNLYFILLQIF